MLTIQSELLYFKLYTDQHLNTNVAALSNKPLGVGNTCASWRLMPRDVSTSLVSIRTSTVTKAWPKVLQLLTVYLLPA